MSKIPTVEEFLQDSFTISHFYDDKTDRMVCFADDVKKAMIEFAKLHVQAAVIAICDNACVATEGRGFAAVEVIDKASIQEAYPLTNIK